MSEETIHGLGLSDIHAPREGKDKVMSEVTVLDEATDMSKFWAEERARERRALRDEIAITALRCLWSDMGWRQGQQTTAETCYSMADAMLKAREQ